MEINKIISDIKVCNGWAEKFKKFVQIKDWLLPMLMNGQVNLGDAEEMVEEKLDMVAEQNENYIKN